ncbi:DUF2845 domain-containing protein [Pseudomonas sp. MAC6]|uniref:DUF2845 domain-containing protein n=1 Tax=Pseudomonas sp. MAC6 TaxID=3401633 RepID=UPI003BF4AA32
MKALISVLLLLVPVYTLASSTLRCDSGLISLDDSTSEVSSKCGEPLSRDFLGYREVLDQYGFYNEVAVEEWSYGPRNGMYQFLRFQGNRLIKIDSKRGN